MTGWQVRVMSSNGAEKEPTGAQMELKWTQMEPNGAQMEPSGAQMELKWSPVSGAQMELKWGPMELKWSRGLQREFREGYNI